MDYYKKHWKIGSDYFVTILSNILVTKPRIYIYKSDINGNHNLDYEGYIDNNYSHKDVIKEYIKVMEEKENKLVLDYIHNNMYEVAKIILGKSFEINDVKIISDFLEIKCKGTCKIEINIGDDPGYSEFTYFHTTKKPIQEVIEILKNYSNIDFKPKKEILSFEKAKALTKEANDKIDKEIEKEKIKVKEYIDKYIEKNIDKINDQIKESCKTGFSCRYVYLHDFGFEKYKNLFGDKIEKRKEFFEYLQFLFQKKFKHYSCELDSCLERLHLTW